MRNAHTGLLILAAAALLAAARPAAAQPAPAPAAADAAAREQANQLLRQGNTQLDQGLYLEALTSFEAAYRAFPSPKLHYSIAQTLNELGRQLEALERYERFVRDVPRDEMPRQWAIANERIFKLQGAIATLHVQTNLTDATVTADGNEVGRTPLAQPLRFLPGRHVVIVAKPGYQQQVVSLTLRAGDAVTRRVELMTEDEAARRTRVAQDAEARQRAAQERLRRTRTGLRVAAWSALGAGLALAATGGTFGLLAQRESDKVTGAGAQCAGTTCVGSRTDWATVSGHYDRAATYRQVMYYGLAIGGALAVAGGVVLLATWRGAAAEAPERPQPPGVRLTAAPVAGAQQVGVVVGGRF